MVGISGVRGGKKWGSGSARRALAILGAAVLVGVGGAGCFTSSTLQGSSESSSDSSGSFSDSSGSSSRSSSGEEDQQAYYRDVRDSAASAAATHQDSVRFEREIGSVARTHDILDWERDDETYHEIGRGLASAGIAPERVDALADQISHGDPRRRALIEEGFRADETR